MRDLYIDASHEVFEDLKIRLRGARFPVVLDEQENNAGISVEFMKISWTIGLPSMIGRRIRKY